MDTRQRGKGGAHPANEQYHIRSCVPSTVLGIYLLHKRVEQEGTVSVPGQPLIDGWLHGNALMGQHQL